MADAPDTQAPETPGGAEPQPKKELDPSTHFAFQHRIFAVPGARFGLSRMDSEPVMRVMVGELEAAIPIEAVASEFQIDPDSPDGKLLETVRKSLKFVKDIRPGDTIPRELLDGTASWSIDDTHRSRAKGRLYALVDAWAQNRKPTQTELRAAAAETVRPEQYGPAFERLAKSAKLSSGHGKEAVDLVDRVAREFAYIEALRDRYALAHAIQTTLTEVLQANRDDKLYYAEIQRIKALMVPPIRNFSTIFDQVDAEMGEIVRMIRSFDKTILFLREMRDELHQKLMIWDEIIDEWENKPGPRAKAMRPLTQNTYRFVARNFPQSQDWA